MWLLQRLQIEDDANTNYSIVTEAESAPGSVSIPVSSRLVPVAPLTDETRCQNDRDLISDVIVTLTPWFGIMSFSHSPGGLAA